MSWHDYDEKLIRRGELIINLGFVKNYQPKLDAMNRGEGSGSPSGSPTPTSSSSPL